jgi:hypothetical protein
MQVRAHFEYKCIALTDENPADVDLERLTHGGGFRRFTKTTRDIHRDDPLARRRGWKDKGKVK